MRPFFYARGVAYMQKREYDPAVSDFRHAISMRADFPEAAALLSKSLSLWQKQGTNGNASTEPKADATHDPAISVRRVALVIGNATYRTVSHLPNPANDADLVGNALRKAGVDEVTVVHDLDHEGMISALKAFARKADGADWAIIYYAGHGMEMDGKNYLIPVDATLETDRDVPDETVSLERMQAAINGAHQLGLIVLDACRNNPFAQQMKLTAANLVPSIAD